MINGMIKDILAYFQSPVWTEEDEDLKLEIFSSIIVQNKCYMSHLLSLSNLFKAYVMIQ